MCTGVVRTGDRGRGGGGRRVYDEMSEGLEDNIAEGGGCEMVAAEE